MTEKNKKIITEESDLFNKVKLTVKAVVIGKDGKILLLKRSKNSEKHPDKYDLPGGHLDKGEAIEECLKREIKDETGLDIVIGDVISVMEYPKDNKLFDEIKALRFVVYSDSDNVEISEEHGDFEWVTFDEADKKLDSDGYEGEKKKTILKAKKYLETQSGLDGWKRCLAEFENYKKRQAESSKDTIRYATENVVLQILPVLDNFSSSVEHIPEDQKGGGWVMGIMYIKKQLEDVLKENGIEEIDIKPGDDFDTTLCESVADKECAGCKSKDYKFKNKIKKVITKGYKIGEKIIRPARVTVE